MTGNHNTRRNLCRIPDPIRGGAGFTLIELLLVTAVFSVAVLMSTTVYSQRQNDQRRVLLRQQEVSDSRYLLETMARSIRVGTINYLYYDSEVTNPTDILTTTDQGGTTYCYKFQGTEIVTTSSNTRIDCGGGTWTPINSTDLLVDDFKVFITPRSDPFLGLPTTCHTGATLVDQTCQCTDSNDCYSDQECIDTGAASLADICRPALAQPTVTLVLQTHVIGAGFGNLSINMQTTVASHVYPK